jgi:hypothetical protein
MEVSSEDETSILGYSDSDTESDEEEDLEEDDEVIEGPPCER